MAKENDKINDLKKAGQQVVEDSAKAQMSTDRVEKLSQTLFEGINIALGNDEFTHYEINDALLRVAHHFNKRALESQNKSK